MKPASVGNMRVRLVLVVLLALIPALGLIYYNAWEQRRAAIEGASEELGRITRLMATQNTDLLESTRQLLIVLARMPEVRGDDSARCAAVLGELLGEYGSYSDLGTAAPDGTVLCTAVPVKQLVSVANRRWFQLALKMREFAIGEYQVSNITGNPSLGVGYPILGADNQVQRIVFASFDLSYFFRKMGLVAPPEGAELTLADLNGVVLAHMGSRYNRVGSVTTEAARIKEVSSYRGRGIDQSRDADGVERLHAYYPIGSKRGADAYATASIPTAVAFADADRRLRISLIALVLVALLALAGAWFGGETIVLRQTNVELERRVQERTKELAHEQFLLRTLLDNIPDSIYFKDLQGHFLRSSRAQAQRFGLSDPAQAIGKTDFDFFTKKHAEEALADEKQIIQTGKPLLNREESAPLADGTERWVTTSKLPLRDQQGNIVGTFGSSREITERKRAEQALAKERNLLRTLLDNLPDHVFIKDTSGRYIFDNPAHRSLLGVTKLEDVAGKTAFDFYPKELADRVHTDDEAILASEKPVINREEFLTDIRSRKLRVLTSKVPYRDDHNRITGLITICRVLGESTKI